MLLTSNELVYVPKRTEEPRRSIRVPRFQRSRQSQLHRLLSSLVIFLTLSLTSLSPAWAEWGYQVTNEVRPRQKAELTVVAPVPLKRVVARLKSDRSKRVITQKIGQLKASSPHVIRFAPPTGMSHWTVDIEGHTGDGVERITFEFDVLSAGPLKVQFFNEESSLELGRLILSSNRPIDRVELEAFGDEGEAQWQDSVSVSPEGEKLLARFSPRDEVPRRLEIKVVDTAGTWMSYKVARWFTNLPHEELQFASGSSEVSEGEIPKLKAALEPIKEEIEKFRRAMGDDRAPVDLQLYIAGYTDTVGDANDNLKLSQARAQAIGRAFRKLGVTLQIRYAGFGEGGQLVKTADSTDEPRNRRAVYIIANSAPTGPTFPTQSWRTLK